MRLASPARDACNFADISLIFNDLSRTARSVQPDEERTIRLHPLEISGELQSKDLPNPQELGRIGSQPAVGEL